MNILELRNASVKRGDKLALDSLSLTLPLGQHCAIVGPNGAGKSTFLKLPTRELSPLVHESMHFRLFGQTLVDIWQLRAKIGFVSQDYQQDYRSLATGLEVVISAFFGSVGIHPHQCVSASQQARAQQLLRELDIEALSDQRYYQLSTGQQRRLLLARALVHAPQALILDEPTNGLDIQARFWFYNTLRELARSGVTIVLVTHDIGEIIPEIDQVTLLRNGKIFAQGGKLQILNSATLSSLFDTAINVFSKNGYYYAQAA